MPAALWMFMLALASLAAVAVLFLVVKAALAWLAALLLDVMIKLVTWIAYAIGSATLTWLGLAVWQKRRRAARAADEHVDDIDDKGDGPASKASEAWKASEMCCYSYLGLRRMWVCNHAEAKLCHQGGRAVPDPDGCVCRWCHPEGSA